MLFANAHSSICMKDMRMGENVNDGDYINRGVTRKLQVPSEELVEYAEEHRDDTMKLLSKDLPKLDVTTFKTLMEDIIEAMNQQEYVEVHKQYNDSLRGGCTSGIILKDSTYKRSNSKNPKYINKYQPNRFAPISKAKRVKEHHLIELLTAKYDMDIAIALILDKALSRVNNKNEEDGTRYAESTGGSYAKLSKEMQELFFEEFTYTDNKDAKQIGYRVTDNSDMGLTTIMYLAELEVANKPENIDKNKDQYLQVHLGTYSKMSNYTQLHLLRNLAYIEHYTLYIKMQHKQDIGNNGRRGNIIDEIARADRILIELYGVDMESALQTIVYTEVKKIDQSIDLPFTKHYIDNKKQVRDEVSRQLDWSTDRTKREITAIYQGRVYNTKKEGHKELEHIFLERDKISATIFTTVGDGTQATKYASRRAPEKLLKKYGIENALKNYDKLITREQSNVRNTYMFFWWTYFEREIQNIITKELKYPKTLHDAVYTQDEDNFNKLDIKKLEEKILNKTNIPMKLSIE